MYEPLLKITIPDRFGSIITGLGEGVSGQRYKVVVIARVWENPAADRNTVAIVEHLLQSGKVSLIAFGEFDPEHQFPRLPVTLSIEERQKQIEEARLELSKSRIHLADYLGKAFPSVQLVGVNDAQVLNKAIDGRARRLEALRGLYEMGDCLGKRSDLGEREGEPDPEWKSSNPFKSKESFPPSDDRMQNLFGELEQAMNLDLANVSSKEWAEKIFHQLQDIDVAHSLTFDLPDEIRIDLEKMTGSDLGVEIRVTVPGKMLAQMQQLFNSSDIETAYMPPDKPVPIVSRLRAHLRDLRGKRFSPAMHQAEALLIQTRFNITYLTDLLQFAAQHKVNLEDYSLLSNIKRLHQVEKLNLWKANRQGKRLSQAVLDYLMGARVDSHGGLKELFQAEVRKIVHGNKKFQGLLSSRRPLYKCSNQALSQLVAAAADAIENNKRVETAINGPLLNLASIFGFDDRQYTLYRTVTASQTLEFSYAQYERESNDLEEELMAMLAKAEEMELHRIGKRLQNLEKLIREELTSEETQHVLGDRDVLSVMDIVKILEKMGASINDEEKRQARFLYEKCIPPALVFYENAHKSSKINADKVMQAMSKQEVDTAILLCGGFHPKEVVEELKMRQVACSVLHPQLSEEEPGSKDIDLETLKEKASPLGDIIFHTWGKGWQAQLQELLQKEAGEEVMEVEEDYQSAFDDDSASAKEWMQRYGSFTVLEEEMNRFQAEQCGLVLQECRVCHRQVPAPADVESIVCSRRYAPGVILQCPECNGLDGCYICGQCAGRGAIALLPGHSHGDAHRNGLPGMLVCNIHGIPLVARPDVRFSRGGGSSNNQIKKRYLLNGTLPGHSWFGL